MTTPEQPGLLGGTQPDPGPHDEGVGGHGGQRHDLATSTKSASASNSIPERGCLVTNNLNLMYMLAAGLVLPRSGLGEKYYRDTLDVCPGWIPLFTGHPGRAAVDHSIAEARYLRPCQVVVSLRECVGPVMVPGPDGAEKRRSLHEVGGAPLIFIPAPLPVSAIEEILFRSREDATACKNDALDFGNVPLADFKTRVDRKRFAGASDPAWPPPWVPPERVAPLEAAQAAGGMLAMLRILANWDPGEVLESGEPLGLIACRAAFDAEADPPPGLSPTVAAGLTAWMQTGPSPARAAAAPPGSDQGDARRLFWGVVDTLAEQAGVAEVDESNARLLDYLERGSTGLDDRLRKHVVELRETLDALTGLADLTASDLFDRFRTPFPRAVSLLFLRSTCADLLAFEHEALTSEDRLAAALLFGARAGWLTLPLSLRGGPAASAAVSHRMAALSHRLAETGFELGPAPVRPKPLAELFAGVWNTPQRKAAVSLARAQKWTDCLQTRVKAGLGRLRVEGRTRRDGDRLSGRGARRRDRRGPSPVFDTAGGGLHRSGTRGGGPGDARRPRRSDTGRAPQGSPAWRNPAGCGIAAARQWSKRRVSRLST